MNGGGARLEYDVMGHGDRDVLLIPGSVVSEAFQPLAFALTRAS